MLERFRVSLPKPVIPAGDKYRLERVAALPVIVVTADALTLPVVAALIASRSVAAAVSAESVTASLPRPLI